MSSANERIGAHRPCGRGNRGRSFQIRFTALAAATLLAGCITTAPPPQPQPRPTITITASDRSTIVLGDLSGSTGGPGDDFAPTTTNNMNAAEAPASAAPARK